MLPTSPNLSPRTHEILGLNPDGYRQLVVRPHGDAATRAVLQQTPAEKLIVNPPKDTDMLQAVAAGLWLWHDFLEEAHEIAKVIETETGAFWHAIMHRREGDFPNSRYWYAQCREHPALMAITNQSGILLNELPADNRLIRLTFNGWNSGYFVDLVEEFHQQDNVDFHKVLVTLQQLEWRVLLEYCAAMA